MDNITNRNTFLGIFLMLAYAVAMVLSDSIAKHLSSFNNIIVIVWYRYLFHTISLGLFAGSQVILFKQKEVVGNHRIQLFRGLLLALSTSAFFIGIAAMPLAEAIALLYIFPIVSVILSAIFLKERVSTLQKLLILVGFIGVNLVLNISGIIDLTPGLFALAGGVFMGIYMFLTKYMSADATPLVSSLYSGVVGIVFVPFLPGFEFILFDKIDFLLGALMGIFAAIGHFLLFLSMRKASSTVVSPFAFFEVVFAAIIGALWFNDTLSFSTGIGILLLMATGVIFAMHSQRKESST
jgi:drug/metabolite transporter (DMT)-like permease